MSERILRAAVVVVAVAVACWLALPQDSQAQGQGAGAAAGQQAPPAGQAPAVGAPAPGAQGGGGGRGGGGGGGRGGGGAPAGPPPTAQASATVDLTGYWVSLVTEDWRFRMVAPEKGDLGGIGGLTPAGRAIFDAWDPAKDQADGTQCKAYGAGGIMRMPTRLRISWENENVLKIETDAGTQTKLVRFGAAAQVAPGERTWQGHAVGTFGPQAAGGGGGGGGGGGRGGGGGGAAAPAQAAADDGDVRDDDTPAAAAAPAGRGGRGGGGGAAAGAGAAAGRGGAPNAAAAAAAPNNRGAAPAAGARGANPNALGDLRIVTTNLKPGYVRRNGVPYSEKTTVTEFFNRTLEAYGNIYMTVITIVEDPDYLPNLITSSHFKKLPDTNNGWNPAPCMVP